MKYADYFKGKRVTMLGLGLLGRGVGDAAFMAECGAELIVSDLKTEEELRSSVDQLKDFPNITFVLGEHRLEDFRDRDMVLVSAGVLKNSPYLLEAQKNNIACTQSAALFAKLSGVPIIGVTGTRGKTTVTQMIYHVLKNATEGGSVLLGGNTRGVSNLQLLRSVEEDSIAVLELDSWQLQAFGWEGISPQIAVFTNFMEDHLNYYQREGISKEDALKDYFKDKSNVFLHQEESGVFITTPAVFSKAKELSDAATIGQEVVLVDNSMLPEDVALQVLGDHNRLNAALAYEALKATSLEENLIKEGLCSFGGVEGRLQFLREVQGVKIYNDNNATTPAATIAGITAVSDYSNPNVNSAQAHIKNVVLIVGGTDKGIDLKELVLVIEKHCKHVVLYSGTGTEKLKAILPDVVPQEEHERLEDCVNAGFKACENGDVLLFSPAFSSFGKYFRNEYDRNDMFVAAVGELV